MRLPRDLTGAQMARALGKLGYSPIRLFAYSPIRLFAYSPIRLLAKHGSHDRLTCESPGQHHITVPMLDPLRIGTLAAVLTAVADAHGLTRDELLRRLFG